MKKYQIALHGCDDSTYFEMELTAEQVEFLERMVKLSIENSDYTCQPTMEILEIS